MRNDALMNGGLLGFGLGFIAASLALYRVVSTYVPQYSMQWHFRGVIIAGAIGLVVGVGLEIFQRRRMRREMEESEEEEKEQEEEE